MKWMFGCFGIIMLGVCAQTAIAQQAIPLKGTWNLEEQKFFVDVNSGAANPFRIDIKRNSDQDYDVELALTKWKFGSFEVSAILKGSLKTQPDEEGNPYIFGHVTSQYALLNGQVVNGITADFFIHKHVLVIKNLNVGSFLCYGKVDLKVHPEIDFFIQVSELSLSDVVDFLSRENALEAAGAVNGRLKVKGPWNGFQIQGELQSYNGFIGQHKYSSAEIHFEGTYPQIQIYDSPIAQTDGFTFLVQGPLNLSDWKNIETQIKGLVKSPLVTENGQDLEWTFKSLKSEDGGGTTEFKYMLRKYGDQEDGLLGIERRVKF